MAGVYIKGMDKPESCKSCELATHYERYGQEHYCPFMGWYADYEKCPLIPVPPHGRLIDADALDFFKDDSGIAVFDFVTRGQIKAAPTIIPAEREGK